MTFFKSEPKRYFLDDKTGYWIEFAPDKEAAQYKNPAWQSVPSGEEIGFEYNGTTGRMKPIYAP